MLDLKWKLELFNKLSDKYSKKYHMYSFFYQLRYLLQFSAPSWRDDDECDLDVLIDNLDRALVQTAFHLHTQGIDEFKYHGRLLQLVMTYKSNPNSYTKAVDIYNFYKNIGWYVPEPPIFDVQERINYTDKDQLVTAMCGIELKNFKFSHHDYTTGPKILVT